LPAAANQRPTAQVATERRDAESRVMRGPLVSWSYRYDVKSIATERWPTVGLATGAGAAGRLAGSSQAARGVGPAVGRDVVVGSIPGVAPDTAGVVDPRAIAALDAGEAPGLGVAAVEWK